MKLAVLIDPLKTIRAYKDSTLAMLKAAQKRGWDTYFFTLDELFCEQAKAYAHVSKIKVLDVTKENWASVETIGKLCLSEFDIILMRKDPPFNLEYIYATYALELAEKDGVIVANKPQSLRDANEKFFTLNFPQCSPTTLVTSNISFLRQFWEEHQNVIFKPLEGMGGNGIFHVDERGENLSVILETLTKKQTETIMAQRFIPAISSAGDKRILVINGEPVAYALARIPAKGELRGNLAAGAKGEVVAITDRDRWLCNEIAPTLKTKGLYFVGIDVIGDYVTEINVTSPTCIVEIEAQSKLDIAGNYMDFLSGLVN